jgi:hypothetical protein
LHMYWISFRSVREQENTAWHLLSSIGFIQHWTEQIQRRCDGFYNTAYLQNYHSYVLVIAVITFCHYSICFTTKCNFCN